MLIYTLVSIATRQNATEGESFIEWPSDGSFCFLMADTEATESLLLPFKVPFQFLI
jgi:hypothetical protein